MKNILTLFVVFIIGLLMMFWFSNGIRHARTDRKVIALTFDDGPNPTYTEQLLRSLEEKHGLKHIGADVVVGDWKDMDADTIYTRVVRKVRPGSIVVLHDGGGERSATIEAVPLIIDKLRAQGYSFLTVGELLLP